MSNYLQNLTGLSYTGPQVAEQVLKIRTPHTVPIQFSHMDQRCNESPEDNAVELKHLFDWAYPHRDMETRREDLLHRFLDGLNDSQAKYHVAFVKTLPILIT